MRISGLASLCEAITKVGGSREMIGEKLWSGLSIGKMSLILRKLFLIHRVGYVFFWVRVLRLGGVRMRKRTVRLWYGKICNVLSMSFYFRFSYVPKGKKQTDGLAAYHFTLVSFGESLTYVSFPAFCYRMVRRLRLVFGPGQGNSKKIPRFKEKES